MFLKLTMSQSIFWHFPKNESVVQPGYVLSIETSDNQTRQCLANTVDGIGANNWGDKGFIPFPRLSVQK